MLQKVYELTIQTKYFYFNFHSNDEFWLTNFTHTTTAQMLWHVQNCDMISSSWSRQEQIVLLQDLTYELLNL